MKKINNTCSIGLGIVSAECWQEPSYEKSSEIKINFNEDLISFDTKIGNGFTMQEFSFNITKDVAIELAEEILKHFT